MTTKQYRKLNESFRRRLIFHVGVDCGLFVELNYLINAMLYCLAHQIKMGLYSEDANFGTGIGWREYFVSFCEEAHESFHRRYNFHRPPSWKRIVKEKLLHFVAWKLKSEMKTIIGRWLAYREYGEYVLLTQDIPSNPDRHYYIPELGIEGDYLTAYSIVAKMIWQFQPEVGVQMANICNMLNLSHDHAAVQIRGGDKVTETALIGGDRIIQSLNPAAGSSVFVLTDDYRLFEEVSTAFPDVFFATLCRSDERGYVHQDFCKTPPRQKRDAIVRLITSVDILLHSRSFVGSITTGPSRFVMKARARAPFVKAVDCPSEHLWKALSA